MNIKCTRHGFKSSIWEIKNALKSATLYSMSLFVSIVTWQSCMTQFFRGNISMTTKSNTSDTERHIDSLKYTKTNLLLFLGFVPKFLWKQWYKWICPISIYWASRDMHQHLDINMHQEKITLKEKLSKQKFHVQNKYNLGLIQ